MSSPRAYSVRGYAAGDEKAIQRGFAEVFATSRSDEEWRWKFLAPPRGSRIVLAFDEQGELACQYAAIAVDILWRGEPCRAAQIVDVFSRRRHGLGARGGAFQGAMERFLADRAAEAGMAFVYGFPGDRHQRAGAATGHYFPPVAVERLTFRPGDSPTVAQPTLARSWISEGFDAHATDRLWQRSRHRYPHAAVRDAAWFRWRYASRPGRRYLQLGVRRGGETRAWGVVDLEAGPDLLRWVDLLWDGEAEGDLEDLAAAVEARAPGLRGAEPARVELWLRGDPGVQALLGARGYVAAAEPLLRLSAISFDPRLTVPGILERFYLTMGDSDHF